MNVPVTTYIVDLHEGDVDAAATALERGADDDFFIFSSFVWLDGWMERTGRLAGEVRRGESAVPYRILIFCSRKWLFPMPLLDLNRLFKHIVCHYPHARSLRLGML